MGGKREKQKNEEIPNHASFPGSLLVVFLLNSSYYSGLDFGNICENRLLPDSDWESTEVSEFSS